MENFTKNFARAAICAAAALCLNAHTARAEMAVIPADTDIQAHGTNAPADALHSRTGDIINKAGEKIGTITATTGPHGTMLDIDVTGGLSAGKHGMHMHAIGSCDPATGFKSAGGHINTQDKGHGLLFPGGPHEGDLPNLVVGEDGAAHTQVFSHLLTWDLLSDEDGAALIIHEGSDDHMTQPLGGSGGRAACGALVGMNAE